MRSFLVSIRLVIVTQLVCVGFYTFLVWGVARGVTPLAAEGSLIYREDGTVLGSRLVAQDFTQARYFWPRPSAVGFNAAAAGGSNQSPTSPLVAERAKVLVERYGATVDRPLPAELAAASGAGLDPHLTVRGARYQALRVAQARGLAVEEVEALIESMAFSPGGPLGSDRLIHVLEINLALDARR